MDYPLEQLDPERFQKLCQALLVREHKGVRCFPVGQPDGGRDATTLAGDDSKSFLVFQVKFVREPANLSDVRKWVVETLKHELPKVEELARRGASRYFLLTNVQGTSHLDVGSMDKADRELAALPIPATCLWRDDICRRLDNAWELKWVYPELMTGPDLIHALVVSGLSENQERRGAAIRAFLRDQHFRDSDVKFKQVELQNKLLDLFIDVPVTTPQTAVNRKQFHQLARIFRSAVGDTTSADSSQTGETASLGDEAMAFLHSEDMPAVGAASLLLHPVAQEQLKRAVLEGAPGQGKSTITQYVCQVHRMRLLDERDELLQIPPQHRSSPVRIPFRVDLRDLAAWLERRDPFSTSSSEPPVSWQRSLESFLAAQVRYHSGGIEFSVADLLAVMKVSAVLLALDGLDEVAQIKHRSAVVDEIRDGVRRLEANSASLQVIVTSRPAAFANSPGLPADAFPYLELGSVSRQLIDEYSEKWLAARRLGASESRDVRRILKEKLNAPHLRDLARNPMQLAILLSLIHTRGASLPDKRTALYDSYVELFFNREAEKSTVVRDHRYLLINIHRYLAWVLHARSEIGKASGSIRAEELEQLLVDYLKKEGHSTSLVSDLFAGMVERVVAIVSRVQGTYEFEVQPLREYFAARHLYETAPYSPPGNERKGTKPERFDAIARNFYWLNVTRFYAGCYSVGELPSLIDGLQALTNSEDYRYLSHPRILGAMLLSDWVFTQHPRSVRLVVDLILENPGLHFVLATDRSRGSSSTALVLPVGGGREELLERAFNLLRENPKPDFVGDLIELIVANGGSGDVRDRWRDEVERLSGDARTRWLEYGIRLGLFKELGERDLDSLLSDQPLSPRRVSALIRGHRTEWIEASDERMSAAIEAVLSGRVFPGPVLRNDSLIEEFGFALNPGIYSAAFHAPTAAPLIEFAERYGGPRPGQSAKTDHKTAASLAAAEVVEAASGELNRPAGEWATSLSPWSIVIETARKHWGDQPALFTLANLAAGIRSVGDKSSGANSLLDTSVPLCARVRYARLRAGNSSWWARQLDDASGSSQTLLICQVLLTWASPQTIAQLLERIDERVNRLSSEGWWDLHRAVDQALSRYSFLASSRHKPIDASLLRADVSERTICLIGLRCDSPGRQHLYRAKLRSYGGRDSSILSFCQTEALRSLLGDNKETTKDLKIVERCYSRGILPAMHRHARFLRAQSEFEMSDSLAAAIVGRPDRYPAVLIGLAEAKVRAKVGKRVAAVGTVAASEKWFDAT